MRLVTHLPLSKINELFRIIGIKLILQTLTTHITYPKTQIKQTL